VNRGLNLELPTAEIDNLEAGCEGKKTQRREHSKHCLFHILEKHACSSISKEALSISAV
jgi:hypothetical protein